MKKILLLTLCCFATYTMAFAQKKGGPAEKKFTDAICTCMSGLDMSKVKTKEEAEKLFLECFTKEPALIMAFAEERKVDMTDHPAMRQLGIEVGKNLMSQNCKGFVALSMVMSKGELSAETNTGETTGTLKRIETKDFNYFVLTDSDNKERSFIWLRHFEGADKFTTGNSMTGKKLLISWQEMEVYIPSAKGYYTIKEVTGIEVL